jgi:hypothetical protein
LAVADSQEPVGVTLNPKVAPLPIVFWMVTVCEPSEVVPAVIAILPGVMVKKPLVVDPVFAPQLVFCV